MDFPTDLKYTKDHEWIRIDGEFGWIGITDYAQQQLGDIVLVEIPSDGLELKAGDSFGVVESVKTVSDLYAPATGIVAEGNDSLLEEPNILNQDPYGEGWIVKVRLKDPKELSTLMDARAYQAYLEEEQT